MTASLKAKSQEAQHAHQQVPKTRNEGQAQETPGDRKW